MIDPRFAADAVDPCVPWPDPGPMTACEANSATARAHERPPLDPSIWIAVVASLLGCLASACHVALRSFSRKRLADLLEERGRTPRYERLIAHEHLLVLTTGALRAGFSVVITLACFRGLAPFFATGGWGHWAAGFVLAITLLLVFMVGIPVSWGQHRAERLLARAAGPLILLSRAMTPIVQPLHWLDPVVRRISGVDIEEEDDDVADEVLSAIEEHEEGKNVGEAQREMLEAVLELPKTTAGEVMTPRTDVHGIEFHSDLTRVKHDVLTYGHSRIPVYEENLDNIRGILYAKDLIRYLGDGEDFSLADVVRDAFLVPESKPVSDLLTEFKQRKVHIALVLDEYGGTAGLVSIEDILEEIVGDIHDEHETADDTPELHYLDEKTAIVDARMHIDDVNDALSLDLPEDEDYETLGGFVFSTLGHVPEAGESFDFDATRLTVMEAERTKVLKVRIEKLETEKAANGKAASGEAA